MSNFSFSHCVFKKPVLQTCKTLGLFGKELTLYQTAPSFLELGKMGFENIIGTLQSPSLVPVKPRKYTNTCAVAVI